MTSLFATLIAAAKGEADIVEPRPRGRFEDAEPQDIEWREETFRETPATRVTPMLVRHFPERPDPQSEPAGLRGQRVAARRETRARRSGRASPPGETAESKAPQVAPRPVALPVEQPRRTLHSEPIIDGERRPDRVKRTVAAKTQPIEPLMPRTPDGRVERLRDPSIEGRGKSGQDDRSDGQFLLRIGRIEVRPPVSQPQHSAPSPPTRPVILQRAKVRQTLDEYRSGRRR